MGVEEGARFGAMRARVVFAAAAAAATAVDDEGVEEEVVVLAVPSWVAVMVEVM